MQLLQNKYCALRDGDFTAEQSTYSQIIHRNVGKDGKQERISLSLQGGGRYKRPLMTDVSGFKI